MFLFGEGGKKMGKDRGQVLIVDKVVNNNIVIAKDFRGREVVAIGKGLGFRKNKNQPVYPDEIMKTYVLVDQAGSGVFTLFEEVPFEVIETAQKIIDHAQEHLKGTFNVNLLISLADHINFSMIQYQRGNEAPKLVNEEVKRFYKEEYQVGQDAVKMINERFGITLPKEEATSIAFHLITATENKSNHQTLAIMKAVSDIVKIVEDHMKVTLDEDSLTYSRFIIHLKFFLKNILSHQVVQGVPGMEFLLDQIRTEYTDAIGCVRKISDYIVEKFHYMCSDEDCIYLMLHIVRLYETTKN